MRNANQLVEDAKLLIENSSFGHATALLRFAVEELAKAWICWLASEGIWPIESKIVKDVFKSHHVKNKAIALMIYAAVRSLWPKELMPEIPTKEELVIAPYTMRFLSQMMEENRQNAIYVNIEFKSNKILTPQAITQEEAKKLLQGVTDISRIIVNSIETTSESTKEDLRQFANSIPREVWKTGKNPKRIAKEGTGIRP